MAEVEGRPSHLDLAGEPLARLTLTSGLHKPRGSHGNARGNHVHGIGGWDSGEDGGGWGRGGDNERRGEWKEGARMGGWGRMEEGLTALCHSYSRLCRCECQNYLDPWQGCLHASSHT